MSNNIVLVVEDGSGVTNANTYVALADAVAYALQRGVVLTDDDTTAAMLIQAVDYLEARALEYQGYPSSDTQALQWPRQLVFFNDTAAAAASGMSIECGFYGVAIGELPPFPSNQIPKQLVTAQLMLVMAVNQGIALMPNVQPTDYVISEAVGPIKTQYADPSKVGITPMFTGVNLVLQPLFRSTQSNGFGLQTVRS